MKYGQCDPDWHLSQFWYLMLPSGCCKPAVKHIRGYSELTRPVQRSALICQHWNLPWKLAWAGWHRGWERAELSGPGSELGPGGGSADWILIPGPTRVILGGQICAREIAGADLSKPIGVAGVQHRVRGTILCSSWHNTLCWI